VPDDGSGRVGERPDRFRIGARREPGVTCGHVDRW
jgi:hypothetical protein